MSETATLTAARVPTVYFIDDSATMREVIKIAFRNENVNVIACPDAASALAQFSEAAPDAVITDIIIPDKDGYEVCKFIKHHGQFGRTPVILMSGVVNRGVAEKAMAVKADELMRKPFHPQDLIARVKTLLASKFPPPRSTVAAVGAAMPPASVSASGMLTSFFASAHAANAPLQSSVQEQRAIAAGPPVLASPAATAHVNPIAPRAPIPAATSPSADVQKLRNEIRRLELLVKKLQAELSAEHEYCTSLEAHLKTLED